MMQVARVYCHGKHAANMKVLVQQLEAATGGMVVHKAGGTVLLYRGDGWQGGAQPLAGQPVQEGEQQEAQQGEQQPVAPEEAQAQAQPQPNPGAS